MAYELWDGEVGVRLGTYASESEALTAVATLREQGLGSFAPLGLIADGQRLVAAGEALVRRAQETAASRRS